MKLSILIAAFLISLSSRAQSDTTRKDSSYVLTGKLTDFQLLYAAINSPGDVTPNQIKYLSTWLQTLKKNQEADKPKNK